MNEIKTEGYVNSEHLDIDFKWLGRAGICKHTRLVFVLRGRLRFWLYENAVSVLDKEVIVINKGQRIKKWFSEDDGAEFYIIDTDFFENKFQNGDVIKSTDVQVLENLLYLIHNRGKQEREYLLKALEYELTDDCVKKSEVYKRACEYTDKHIDENITLDDVSNAIGCRNTQISRIFAECSGTTFKNYVVLKRVAQIKTMLEFSDYSLRDIADKLGFNDANLLNKFFTYHTQMSPSEYRMKKTLYK